MISSKQDWWNTVNKHWPQLRDMLYTFLPVTGHADYDGSILMHLLAKKLEELKEQQDDSLATYFQAAWGAAPDNQSIHSIPCWGILCNLCSEDYVLYEDLIPLPMGQK